MKVNKKSKLAKGKAKKAKAVKVAKIQGITYMGDSDIRGLVGDNGAQLLNCRATEKAGCLDLVQNKDGYIKAGSIIAGKHGYAVATRNVTGVALKDAKQIAFKANAVVIVKTVASKGLNGKGVKTGVKYKAMVTATAQNYAIAQTSAGLRTVELETGRHYGKHQAYRNLASLVSKA